MRRGATEAIGSGGVQRVWAWRRCQSDQILNRRQLEFAGQYIG